MSGVDGVVHLTLWLKRSSSPPPHSPYPPVPFFPGTPFRFAEIFDSLTECAKCAGRCRKWPHQRNLGYHFDFLKPEPGAAWWWSTRFGAAPVILKSESRQSCAHANPSTQKKTDGWWAGIWWSGCGRSCRTTLSPPPFSYAPTLTPPTLLPQRLLICTTIRRISASASSNQRPRHGDFILHVEFLFQSLAAPNA